MKPSFFLGVLVGAVTAALVLRQKEVVQASRTENLLEKMSEHVRALEARTQSAPTTKPATKVKRQG